MTENKTLYIAVTCQNDPQHIILLTDVQFEGQHSEVFVMPKSIDADCEHCKTHQRFDDPRLMLCWGQPPNETFQRNPNFRE
jgi:hypothetical protein